MVEWCLGEWMVDALAATMAGSVSRFGSLFFLALQVDRLSAARKNAEKAWKPTDGKPPGLGKKQRQHERIGSVGAGLGGGGRWAREMGWLQAFDSLDSLDSLDAHRKASAAPRSLDQASWPRHAKERHAPALCTSAVQRQVSRLGRHVQMTSRRGSWFWFWSVLSVLSRTGGW